MIAAGCAPLVTAGRFHVKVHLPMSDTAKQATAIQGDSAKVSSGNSGHKPEAAEAEPAKGKSLTPEEQMALYEKELKENDWGHQPC